MNLPSNLFDNYTPPQVFLCQPDKTIIGELQPYDFSAVFKFNTYSETTFTISKTYIDILDGKMRLNPYYLLLDSLRVIYIRGIGHFVIQDVKENLAESDTKTITAFSLEYATATKYLDNFRINTGEDDSLEYIYHMQQYGVGYSIDRPYKNAPTAFDPYERYYIKEYTSNKAYVYTEVQIVDPDSFASYDEGLYIKAYPNIRFYWPSNPDLSLLHIIFSHIPEWKIGHVDKELWYQERTFSEERVAVYDFLYNAAAETFKYAMEWDSINGEVNFYITEEDGITADNNVQTLWDTDVFISRENLASSIDVSYSTDDIRTKLKVTGGEGVDIRDVNLGQNYITNLSFYNDPTWLGRDLAIKYNKYMDEVNGYTDMYTDLMSQWSTAYNEHNELMNHVPVEPRVLLIGDPFDKLYCTYNNTYSSLTHSEIQEMEGLQLGGNVDLFNRPQIPSSKLVDVGWTDAGDGTSTVYTHTYSNEDETIAINVTPILPNGDVMSPDELEGYAGGIIYGEIEDYEKLQIGFMFEGENAIEEAEKAAERIHELQEKYYLSPGLSEEELLNTLKEKLGLYRVGVDDNGTISKIDKTDDILLTLENNANDSVTIRVKCIKAPTIVIDGKDTTYYKNSDYKIYCTKTIASSGLSHTDEYTLRQWVRGELTSDELGLSSYAETGAEIFDFKVKSIGTLGAYLCIAKDETVKDNVAAYGIRLLQEKQGIYTKIFITQTEGYMSKEGFRCVASDKEPIGGSVGDKWLDTSSKNARILICTKVDSNGKMTWEEYSVNEDGNGNFINNSADFENYTRFIENYNKLQIVQEVLAEKQRLATYLKNGYEVESMRNILPDDLDGKFTYEDKQDGANFLGLTRAVSTYFNIDTFTVTGYSGKFGILKFMLPESFNDKNEYAVYVTGGTPYIAYSRSQGVCLAQMNRLSELSSMEDYFTEGELIRLSPFMREDEYNDSNFILTGYESEEEQMSIKRDLLEEAKKELKKISQPKLSFGITMANIMAIPEFAPLKGQFRLGNFVRVKIRDGYVKRARLLEVSINFEDLSDFSCQFGDLVTTKDEISKTADLLQQAVQAGKTVASSSSKWQKGADKATALDKAISEGLKDAALSVSSSTGQSITWNEKGILGRKLKDGSDDTYENEQFLLTNNKLVFTNDNWNTAKGVFGEFNIDLGNGKQETMYGLLADAVVGGYIEGSEIKGGSLEIGGKGGTFKVGKDGSVEIKGSDGKSAFATANDFQQATGWSTVITSSGPTIFTDKNQKTTLTCRVYYQGTDKTGEIPESKFEWIRSSGDSNADNAWNENTEHIGKKEITITHDDIKNNATIHCEVDIETT